MTIALSNSNPVQYLGNGTAVTFSFPWKIFAATDLIVGFIVGGTYTQQSSGFTVAGVGNNGGGSITFAVAPPLTTTVDIRTETAEIQPTEFANLAAYLPENTTNAADRLTRALQDLYRLTYSFGIHGPDQESAQWPALPSASQRANTYSYFDGNGLPTVAINIGTTPFSQGIFDAYYSTAPQSIFNTFLAASPQAIFNAFLAAAPQTSFNAFKPASTTRTNTTTFTNDPDLQVTLPPGTFIAYLKASYSAQTLGGLKHQLAFTGTASFVAASGGVYIFDGVLYSNFQSVSQTFPIALNGGNDVAQLMGDGCDIYVVFTVTVGGTLNFQWAQAGSSANPSTVYVGSALIVNKIA